MRHLRALALGASATIAGCHVVLGLSDGRDPFLPVSVNLVDASTDAIDQGLSLCGDAWVDLARDPNNCGACDHRCGSGRMCGAPSGFSVCEREVIAAFLGSETNCLLKDGSYVYLGSNDEMLRIDVETHNTLALPTNNDEATCSAIVRQGDDLLVARKRIGGPQSIVQIPLHGAEPGTLWRGIEGNPLFDRHGVLALRVIGPHLYFSTPSELARITLADGTLERATDVTGVVSKVLEPLHDGVLWTTGTELLRTTSAPFLGGTPFAQLSATPVATALLGSTLYVLFPSGTVAKAEVGATLAGTDAGVTFETVVTLGRGQRSPTMMEIRGEYAYISTPPDDPVEGSVPSPGRILRVNLETGAQLVLAQGRLRPEFTLDDTFVYFVQEPSNHPDDSPTLVRVPR